MTKKKQSALKTLFPLQEKPLYLIDWIVLLLLMAVLFVSFEMRDLVHTAGCSYGFLDGHIFSFYDYLAEWGIAEDGSAGLIASYLPSVYVIFALWNLPMKIFGFVPAATAQLGFVPLMWAKVLPCLVFFGCGYVLYRICGLLGMGPRKAKFCMFAFFSSPVCLFGQFAIGQYESFMILFVLLGFYYWLRKKDLQFILFFGIALTFKYTAVLLFFPLLVLREKRILRVLLALVLLTIPAVLEFLVFSGSEGFRAGVFGLGADASGSPVGYVTNAAYFTGFSLGSHLNYGIYLAFVAYLLVAAWAYFTKPEDERKEQDFSLYYLGLSCAALFCFSKWHPHWLMLAVPFWTVSAFRHKNTAIFMALEMLFGVLLVMFSVCQFQRVADEVMLNRGIFKFLLPGGEVGRETGLSEYLGKLDMSVELTILTAMMAVFAVFKHPKYLDENPDAPADRSMGWIRARAVIPMLILLIPTALVLRANIRPSVSPYNEDRAGVFVELSEGEEIVQSFTSEGTTLKKLKFPVSVGENSEKTILKIFVTETSGNVLYEKEISAGSCFEGEFVLLKPGISLNPGTEYEVRFVVTQAEPDSSFRLLGMEDPAKGYGDAVLSGQAQQYHMDLLIYQ